MDAATAALYVAVLVVALVLGLRALGVWSNTSAEQLAIKRANVERMIRLERTNPKKNGSAPKKSSKDEEGDEVDELFDAMEDSPLVAGIVEGFAKQRGINLDKLEERDPRELLKARAVLEELEKGGAAAGEADGVHVLG